MYLRLSLNGRYRQEQESVRKQRRQRRAAQQKLKSRRNALRRRLLDESRQESARHDRKLKQVTRSSAREGCLAHIDQVQASLRTRRIRIQRRDREEMLRRKAEAEELARLRLEQRLNENMENHTQTVNAVTAQRDRRLQEQIWRREQKKQYIQDFNRDKVSVSAQTYSCLSSRARNVLRKPYKQQSAVIIETWRLPRITWCAYESPSWRYCLRSFPWGARGCCPKAFRVHCSLLKGCCVGLM